MDFGYEVEAQGTEALTLRYFQVPWDTELFGFGVGQIESIEVREPGTGRNGLCPLRGLARAVGNPLRDLPARTRPDSKSRCFSSSAVSASWN
jgi:hypothetical protein